MPLVVKKKAAVAQVAVEHKEGPDMAVVSEQHHQEEVPLPETVQSAHDAPHAMIEVSTSLTINLGKYNSVKVGVGITLPAALNELEEVFEYGRSWINQKMELLASEVSPDQPAND